MKIKSLSGTPPLARSWLLTGTVVLLVMLFSAMIVATTVARRPLPTNH